MSVFKELTLRFQTSAQLPPPYCYEYVLKLQPNFQYLEADFQMVYTHREDLDADELEAEGFTPNDDFAWKGNLEKAWRPVVENLLAKTQVTDKEPHENNEWLQIVWQNAENEQFEGFPKPVQDWLFLAQELQQAIFETSEKERPFEMSAIKNDDKGSQEMSVKASFKYRDVQIRRNEDGKPKFRNYPWEKLPELMQTLFDADYLADQAVTKKPHQKGIFLNIGDELWYEMGKQVVEPYRNANTLVPLKKLIDRLFLY